MKLCEKIFGALFCISAALLFNCATRRGNMSQTKSDRPREFLNVKDFGATGDGITSDLAAIQACIDSASQGAGGGVVYFPSGVYRLDEIVELKSNIHLWLEDDAVLLNAINIPDHPSIPLMTGSFTDDGAQVYWDGIENVTVEGGVLDMNGSIQGGTTEAGSKTIAEPLKRPDNLPLVNSSGGFAIGYSKNIRIKNMTMRDAYNGHAIQICASENVSVENCIFEGHAVSGRDSSVISKEYIQIEPGTRNGFPYSSRDTGEAAHDVVIRGCTFRKSEKSGEIVTAIGTHNQMNGIERCYNITIENNVFDNPYYCGMRFCGYDNMTIQNNAFIMRSIAESVQARSSGRTLINGYSYYSSNYRTEVEPNSNIKVLNNTFTLYDSNGSAIRFSFDQRRYNAYLQNIEIAENTIINNGDERGGMAINVDTTKNLTVRDNSISGFDVAVNLQDADAGLNLEKNNYSGNNINNRIAFNRINVVTHEKRDVNLLLRVTAENGGFVTVNEAGGTYTFSAEPETDARFLQWKDGNAANAAISEKAITFNLKTLSENSPIEKTAVFDR